MQYEFKQVGGDEIIERSYSAKDAPPLGFVLNVDGNAYERVVSLPPGPPAPLWKPYESFSMPDPGDLCAKSPRGLPIVTSQAHEREVCAHLGRKRD